MPVADAFVADGFCLDKWGQAYTTRLFSGGWEVGHAHFVDEIKEAGLVLDLEESLQGSRSWSMSRKMVSVT
ncbi:MAG: hypothetical protein R2864_11560 [Syntrophotaleaceae bacterium]